MCGSLPCRPSSTLNRLISIATLALQMPSFGDELQLGGGMDQMNQNVKMEQGLQQPAGTGPGMVGFITIAQYLNQTTQTWSYLN